MPTGLHGAGTALRGEFDTMYRPLIDRRRRRASGRSGARQARMAAVDAQQSAPDGLAGALDPSYGGRLARHFSTAPGRGRAQGEAEAIQAQLGALGTDASLQSNALGALGTSDQLTYSDMNSRRRAKDTRKGALLNSALSIGSFLGGQALTNLGEGGSIFNPTTFDVDPNSPTIGEQVPVQGNFLQRFFHY